MPSGKVCIGRDTRQSGSSLETALANGFASAGFEVELVGVLPTPGIAYCVRHSDAQLGVAITASHNPYVFNGLKFFDENGEKLDFESDSQQLSRLAAEAGPMPDATALSIPVSSSSRRKYMKALQDRAERVGQLNLKAVVDCANGATAETAPTVLCELVEDIKFIGTQPDGRNINEGIGSTNLAATQSMVRARNADIGIAFDGDGDRVLFVDDCGVEVTGDQILFLLAKFSKWESRNFGVVGTDMSNEGLAIALKKLDIGFERTEVGDKHVLKALHRKGWQLGGEPSGHVISLGETHSGDGLWIALCVLEILRETGVSIKELLSDIQLFPQAMRQIDLSNREAWDWERLNEEVVNPHREELLDQGRILVRRSGTEPTLRVMVEHPQESTADAVANRLTAAIDSWLRQIELA